MLIKELGIILQFPIQYTGKTPLRGTWFFPFGIGDFPQEGLRTGVMKEKGRLLSFASRRMLH